MNTQEIVEEVAKIMDSEELAKVEDAVKAQEKVIEDEKLLSVKKSVYVGCNVTWNDKDGNELTGKVKRINENFVRVDLDDETSQAVLFQKLTNIQ
jgi:uncharacterized protein YkvS